MSMSVKAVKYREGGMEMTEEQLLPHSIEQTAEYQLAWNILDQTTSRTSYIRRQAIARRSAASLSFKQADQLFTTRSEVTSIEGDGLRLNFFVSGCQFNCVNCFNQSSQKFGYGKAYAAEDERELLEKIALPFIDGLTFVGGEPFQSARHLCRIAHKIKQEQPEKSIWSYTGYLVELLAGLDTEDPRRKLLNLVDVLIDGPFIDEERDESDLKLYRGSSNQRLIDVQETLRRGQTVEYVRRGF